MRGFAVPKNSLLVGSIMLVVASVAGAGISASRANAQSAINAIICGAGAHITISEPQSDSVMTTPSVTIIGAVAQAGQIEVAVDGTYDSVIPLDVGQTTYESTIQLPQGTHTIQLTAVDSCGSTNAEETVVVTFTPPPSSDSNGSDTQTGVAPEVGGVSISSQADDVTVKEVNPGGLLPAPLAQGLNNVLKWMNIASSDSTNDGLAQLSLARAAVLTTGVYMAVIGVAQSIITLAAATPLFHRVQAADRIKIASRIFRIIGALLIIGAFIF